ncbi:hypothetical protein BYT27DRAFT_7334507 [Phlegmacium glaucopus]|nr:hypothetical protein BYT27DRAFT_7334507 [Phlegmacium glaucopus]
MSTEEDTVSIISFDDELYLEDDNALPGSDIRIRHWLTQQCRFALEVDSTTLLDAQTKEKDLAPDRIGPYALGGPGELLSSVLMTQSTSTVSEQGGEAALRADSPLLGFGGKGVGDGNERTLLDPLHFPSATYVRDLPRDSINFRRKHSPHSSHSSNTSSSRPAHGRCHSTSSSPRRISLGLSPLSRRPSLLRQPSLPLLGELDDEPSPSASTIIPQAISPHIPQAGRSRAQSNASISSFHLPTSMQHCLQSPPPTLSPIPSSPPSPPQINWKHSRIPNSPPVSSTLASLSFGAPDNDGGAAVKPLTSPIPRPQSQIHAHRQQPVSIPQLSPSIVSRSSSTLSLALLANNPNNRNAVYIDDDSIAINPADDIEDDLVALVAVSNDGGSVIDSPTVEAGDSDRLQGHHTLHTNTGVYSNGIGSSSQVYLGSGSTSTSGMTTTTAKKPTRPPPAPPLIMDEVIELGDDQGGLGGVGVVDEDAISSSRGVDVDEKRPQFSVDDSLWRDRSVSAVGDVYLHRRQPSRQQPHEESDFDTECHDTDTEADADSGEPAGDNNLFMSRWSLTSSMDENLPSSSAGGVGGRGSMVSAFGVVGGSNGGGGLFGSRKRRSLEKEKSVDDKETEKEKHTDSNKKRGRLVSFISRISHNIGSPPPSASFQHTTTPSSPSPSLTVRTHQGFEIHHDPSNVPLPATLGYWFGDMVSPSAMGISGIGVVVEGKKRKDKNKENKKKKGKESQEESEEKVDVNNQEESGKEAKDSIDSLEAVPASPAGFPVPAHGADSTATVNFKANQKAALLQLRVDTSVHSGGHQQPQFGQLPKTNSATSPVPSLSSPRICSSPESLSFRGESHSMTLGVSQSPNPAQHRHSLHPQHQQLKALKPIVTAFSDGVATSGSPSGEGGNGGAMSMGMRRVRSSSAADLLEGSGGAGGYYDSYPYHAQQHQYHAFGQQGQVQGPGQSQSQSQARRYASGDELHAQSQDQNRQQGYSSEASSHQPQQRQRRQSQPLQSQIHTQSELQQPPQQQDRQSQTSSSVNDGYYVLEGASSLMSPAAIANIIAPRRPVLVKSVSTSMLNLGSGGYYGMQDGYVAGDARRSGDLPDSPILFATTHDDDSDDEDDFGGSYNGVRGVDGEDEEEDYGVEASHAQRRGGGGGGGLTSDSETERDIATREREAEHKKLETEHEENWGTFFRREQSQSLEKQSTATTSATLTTTSTATPRASIDAPSPSSAAPSIKGSTVTTRSSDSANIVVTKTQEKMQLLVEDVDERHDSRLRSLSDGAVALMPTPAVKTGTGSSKGFRGFVERMKFATISNTSSSSSSPSPSPIIPPLVPTSIASATSTASLFTSTTVTTTAAPNAPSSPSALHSPATSFVMGSSAFLNNDGLFGPDNQKKKQKKQPKRKLVINGVSENDVQGYEAVKAWCESFGEIREMKRTPDGHLHVDFRKASVAETSWAGQGVAR